MKDPALLEARLRQRATSADPVSFDADLMRAFGGRRAVLITDLSGFSRRTLEAGTPTILALIQTKRDLLRPVLQRFHAQPLRFYADNTFAGFEHAHEALNCALAMNETLDKHNRNLP